MIIYRSRCIQITVVITVISCDQIDQRTQLLNNWILIAEHLLMQLGNIFAFVNVMSALCSRQV